MGNAGARMQAKDKRVVRVTKVDGKMLEFHAPVLVKDLLTTHPNCYVGAFREATQPLPSNYKLRVGKVYYLLPSVASNAFHDSTSTTSTRVKVVITKQQLKMLMARQMVAHPSGSRLIRFHKESS